jgi:mono/diheme cytochrome c family protein
MLLAGCSVMRAGASAAPTTTPVATTQGLDGERLFSQNCAACHGAQAVGTKQGPPLVHKIYEPSHHGDAAFVLAARNGSKQHHWRFGDMPPQPQLTEAQVKAITAYVRALQRDAGIR